MDGKDLPPPQHQVFINFRGAELRNNFLDHLQSSLKRRGINVFIDTNEDKGEDISKLFKRIEDSRIALAVFSSRYTESVWCLDELAKIKERVDLGMLKVLPIFYKIETLDVKQLKGNFGDKFREQKRKYPLETQRIKKWKAALESISGKLGLRLTEESSEANFLERINEEVLRMLASISSAAQTANSQINPFFDENSSEQSRVDAVRNSMRRYQERKELNQGKVNPSFDENSSKQSRVDDIRNSMRRYLEKEELNQSKVNASKLVTGVPYSSVQSESCSSWPSDIHSFKPLSGPTGSSHSVSSLSVSTSVNGGPVSTTEKVWYSNPDTTTNTPHFLPMENLSFEDIVKHMNDDTWSSRMLGSSSK
uniref:Protein PHLOEM PROTEIN 2-LIKE A8 n=1 Tax=Noccaea caerulescens TaxID=107243 RepID=A0A1J3IML7_NOCCA